MYEAWECSRVFIYPIINICVNNTWNVLKKEKKTNKRWAETFEISQIVWNAMHEKEFYRALKYWRHFIKRIYSCTNHFIYYLLTDITLNELLIKLYFYLISRYDYVKSFCHQTSYNLFISYTGETWELVETFSWTLYVSNKFFHF